MMNKTWLMPSIGSLMLAYSVLYIWQPGGGQLLNLVTDVSAALFALLASTLAMRASRMFESGTAARRAWLLFGVGMAAMALAELIWMYYHDVLDQPLPFPSPADILWAVSHFPILASLILQYRALGVQATHRRNWLVVTLCLSVLIAALTISVSSTFSQPGPVATTDLLINAFYLIGDLSIACIAILSLLFLQSGLVSKPWQYMVTSVLLFVIADLTFSYGSANELYATGSNALSGVVDVAYLAAYVMAAAGGYRQLTLRLPA